MKKELTAKEQYDIFNESGDLKMLFPGMSGDWEKDGNRFTKIWRENQRLLEESDFYNDDNK